MSFGKKLGLLIFLTVLLTITSALSVRAQTATPPTPQDVLIQTITERAQKDVELGKLETTEGLDALFGAQAKLDGMPLSEVVKIYENAYGAAKATKPWWDGWLPNLGWIAAIIALLAAIFRGVIEDIGKKFFNMLGEALYNRFAGYKPFWMLALRRYKVALYEKNHVLKLLFRPGHPLEMKEVYVPVKVSSKNAKTSETLFDAYQAIEKHRKLVVLGAPGAGKSILLHHVALTYAEGDLNEPLVPVLVELNRLNNAGTKMFDQLVMILKQNDFPNGENFLKTWLKTGQLLLMFDGLDEVNADWRMQVSVGIRDLLAEYPQCHAIVTCRTQVYRGEFADWADQTLEVAEFSDQQTQHFLFAWQKELPQGKSVEHLLASLTVRPRILALARNPLMLTIIAFLYADTEFVLPNSRAEFYDTAVMVMLGEWKEQYSHYELAEKLIVMRHLALFMQGIASNVIDLTTLLLEIKKALPALALNDDDARPLLKEFIARSGLLLPLDNGLKFQFAHQSLQEFFAAQALRDEADGLLRRFKTDPDVWRETVKLWCGLEHDSTHFLTGLYEIDILLTFECMVETQNIGSVLADKLIDEFKSRILAGETDEDFLRTFAAIASDSRSHSQLFFQFLITVVSDSNSNFEQISAASQILAMTNSPEAANILVSLAETNELIRPYILLMGDNAIPFLEEPAKRGAIWALDALYQIGTIRAARIFTMLLFLEAGQKEYFEMTSEGPTFFYPESPKYHAAWRLSALLPRPEIEEGLRSISLTLDQRKAEQIKWIWEPFNEPVASALPIIVGRIAYLISIAPENTIPMICVSKLDPRLSIPLCTVVIRNGRIIDSHYGKKTINLDRKSFQWPKTAPEDKERESKQIKSKEELHNFLNITNNSEQGELEHSQRLKNFIETHLPNIKPDMVWRYLFTNSKVAIQLDLLRHIDARLTFSNEDDWRQIFHPMLYNFNSSWHARSLKFLLTFASILNILLLCDQIRKGTTLWGWENALYVFEGIGVLIILWLFLRAKLDSSSMMGLIWIFVISIGPIAGIQSNNLLLSTSLSAITFAILVGIADFFGTNKIITGMISFVVGACGNILFFDAVDYILSKQNTIVVLGSILIVLIIGFAIFSATIRMILFTFASVCIGFFAISLFISNATKYLLGILNWPGLMIFWIFWVGGFALLLKRADYLERRARNPLHDLIQHLPNVPKQAKRPRSWLFDILPNRGFR
jgi:hypothetical protein